MMKQEHNYMKILIPSVIKRTALLVTALLLTSCSTVNTKLGGLLDLDTDLTLTFTVEKNVNPDDSKIPSPLIIRMYELSSTKVFENANFIDLYERDAEVLGSTMISAEALKALKPGEVIEVNAVLSKDTLNIGLYAEFLQYENAKYKVIIPIEQTNVVSSSAHVQLTENQMVLTK